MSKFETNSKKNKFSYKRATAYSIGQISDIASYQTFTFLTFTFYFAVVGLRIELISLGFVIWSIWNSLNDTFIGYLSDRTHTRFGRRIPWIMFSLIPIALILFLLYTPPVALGLTSEISNFVYFLVIIILFELFFTMYDINFTSLYPEIFITVEERTKGNNMRQLFAIIGLIAAFVLPGLFITDYSDPQYLGEYQFFSIIVGIIILVAGVIFLKFSPKEKAEFKEDYMKAPSFINTIKTCVKSKSFIRYIPAEICNWFVYGMLPTIVPLYGKFVLNIENTLILSLLLGFTFISAAIFMTILWKPVVQRMGPRKAWLISMSVWILTLLPLMFISDMISGIIVFFLIGIGLSGSLYIIDIVIADIVDEDEVNTGIRREGGYYGVNIFFQRLATIFVFLIIGPVFLVSNWQVFDPSNITAEIIFGLRSLMFIYPAIALIIAIIAIYFYPLDGKKLKQVKEEREKIHREKQAKL